MRLRYRAVVVGRLAITTCMQGSGAPVIDRATTHDAQGRWYRSRAILLKPWRARSSSTVRSRALVVGWRG